MCRSPKEIQEKLKVMEQLFRELSTKIKSGPTSYEMTMNLFLLRGYISGLKWASGKDDRFDILIMQKTVLQISKMRPKN